MLLRSSNSGSSFSAVTVTGAEGSATGNTFKGVVVDPVNSSYVYAFGKATSSGGSVYNFFKSSSSGTGSFAGLQIGTNKAVTALAFDTTGSGTGGTKNILATVETRGIYRSTDWGATWTRVNTATVTFTSITADPFNPGHAYASNGANGISHSADGGATWAWIGGAPTAPVCMVQPRASGSGKYVDILTSANDVKFSNDAATTWTTSTGSITGQLNSISPKMTTGRAGVYVGGNNGVFSLLAPSAPPGYTSPADAAAAPLNAVLSWDSLADISTYHLWVAKSSDFTNIVVNNPSISTHSYTNINLTNHAVHYWRVSAANVGGETGYQGSTRSFTAESTGTITVDTTRSSNHPKLTWQSTSQTPENPTFTVFRYQCAFADGDCGSTGTAIGSTTNSWFVDAGVTLNGGTMHSHYYYYVVASANSNKVRFESTDTPVGKGAIADGAAPRETRLLPSYPNPFNPSTTISYDLSKDGFVSLKVYNILGQEVVTLVNAEQQAGTKSVTFDGSRLGSGVYFCAMQAPGYTKMMKLMLVK